MSLTAIAPCSAIALAIAGMMGLIGSSLGGKKNRAQRAAAAALLPAPRRVHYLLLLCAFSAFALYGSLVPFHFQSLGFSDALRTFAEILHRSITIESRSDWITNVLLSLPLGYFAIAALAVDQPGWAHYGWQIPLVIIACTCFSVGLEFAQLWIPARTCSQNDIAAQALGATAGCFAWVLAGQRITNGARSLFIACGRDANVRLAHIFSVVLLIYSLLPLDLITSPVEIYHKLKAGAVVFQPIAPGEFSRDQIAGTLTQALMFGTLGILIASDEANAGVRRRIIRAGLWGMSLSAIIEVAQLLVISRYTKVSDIVLGAVAAATGAIVFATAMRPADQVNGSISYPRSSAWRWYAIAVIYAIVIAAIYAAPFQWLHDPTRIAKRWHNLWNIPFGYSKYWSDPLDALADVAGKLILFASLGCFLAKGIAHSQHSGRKFVYLSTIAAVAAFSMAIELLQVYLPPHVADVTDVLIAALGGFLGAAAMHRL